jgi:hypothetical protein
VAHGTVVIGDHDASLHPQVPWVPAYEAHSGGWGAPEGVLRDSRDALQIGLRLGPIVSPCPSRTPVRTRVARRPPGGVLVTITADRTDARPARALMPTERPRTGARRRSPMLFAIATLVGVWLGATAPSVSPVTPAPPSAAPAPVAVQDALAPATANTAPAVPAPATATSSTATSSTSTPATTVAARPSAAARSPRGGPRR